MLALLAGCGGGSAAVGKGGQGGGGAGAAGSAASGHGGSSGGASGTGGSAGAAGSAGAGGGAGTAGGAGGVGGTAVDAGDGGPADGDAGSMCVPVERPVAGFKPDILVLIDISASMNHDVNDQICINTSSSCGANSKWAQTAPAVEQVVSATETTVNWGLKPFAEFKATAQMPDVGCTVSDGVAVPVAGMSAAAVTAAIAARTDATGGLVNGGSQTPTRAAVMSAVAYLSTLTDGNPRFILLATDGLPNCNAATNDHLMSDAAATIQAVADASNAGIATFVIGIGSDPLADDTLSRMAVAGGYPRPSLIYPSYYPVSSASDLIAALNQLVGIARSCRLPLAAPLGFTTDAIDVRADGAAVPRDASHLNGWDYADATHTSFNLYGSVCDAIMNGVVARISVVYRCS